MGFLGYISLSLSFTHLLSLLFLCTPPYPLTLTPLLMPLPPPCPPSHLQPPQFAHDVCERLTRPGVAVGLAWTGMGGEIMFIEASRMQGSGELVLTGQLGDVMKESAQIALNWVRASSQQVDPTHYNNY